MTRKKTMLIGLSVAIIIAGIIAIWVFRPSSTTVKSKKADIEISAEDLVQRYEANEAEANKIYNEKIVLVSGTVESISDDAVVVTVSLKEPDAISGVLCSFDKSTISKDAFTVGEKVKIKGVCTGYLMDVVLTKCVLEK